MRIDDSEKILKCEVRFGDEYMVMKPLEARGEVLMVRKQFYIGKKIERLDTA